MNEITKDQSLENKGVKAKVGLVPNPLADLIQQIAPKCEGLFKSIAEKAPLPALNLRKSARLAILAAIYRRYNQPILLITDRADHALMLAEELHLWIPDAPIQSFPEPTPLFYEEAAWGETTRRERLVALTALASYHIPEYHRAIKPPIIITPARALMTRTLPRRDFLKATHSLHRGYSISLENIIRFCVSAGYESVNTVIATGHFARRGGILDIWPPMETLPVRLEFFGDEIETLRPFEPSTQRTSKLTSDGKLERILVTPARELILPQSDTGFKQETGLAEFHIPLLHSNPACLLNYMPRSSLVLIDDRQALEESIAEVEEQSIKLRADFIYEGTLPDDFPIPYLTLPEIHDALSSQTVINLGPPLSDNLDTVATDSPTQLELSILSDRFIAGPRFGGRLKQLLEYLLDAYEDKEQTFIASRQTARLRELWEEQKPTGKELLPQFIEGSLAEGWLFRTSEDKLVHLLTDGEIFGWRRPEPRQRARQITETPEALYADLQVDDWVVHIDHGIGRFKGLVSRIVEGVEREYLCIEFDNEAQLFVPVHQADRLTRYIGPDNRNPSLNRLGSSEWRKTKSSVKEAVKEVADDLLELYARRNVVQGYSFNPDTAWQQELEASFPYIETDDQMRVISDVKRDMQSQRPMDRLICGDVGYGKTEVALRAAFKATMDGKQVAILVPTTVLAQQHYNTFSQRLAPFPVELEMLSRFRTPQQQREILERLEQAKLDIVIGTHRLLSADVKFKDLGLLIIDEEQRFGVTHKEALKKMRTEVDVLTLTATPIPRTLYMAISGVRDISTINTPPEERLPIVTHVGPYSPRLVRQAILRELERGGQVFFVHNRVHTIDAMHGHLKQIVPEARITIAHGQMLETELSSRMEQFTNGEVDILLTTSIIESGLDIPNANTLIVDRADTFGLAQLYQLRGRVGRGAQRAYAYFFRHNRKAPTLEGRQRLETIAENTQLGAGFSIAMRDLEIRGAGDILGTRQHGHIAAVGFHLYTRLLAEAIRRLRTEHNLPTSPGLITDQPMANMVTIDLPLPISIPADFVPDKAVRLSLYRRIADARSLDELDSLAEEFQDRFGPPPIMVRNLFYQLKLKLLAEKAGLSSISAENGQIVMRFPDDHIPPGLPDPGPLVRTGKIALWMPYTSLPKWTEELTDVLMRLNS